MSKYTKTIKGTYKFDGDTVNVSMRRLKRSDALKLIPLMGEPDSNGNFELTFSDELNFMEVASNILVKKEYIVTLTGLFIEKEEFTINYKKCSDEELKESVFEDAYFMPLMSDIMSDLMDQSFIKEDTEKKSEEQPENTSTDLVTTNP